MSQFKVSIITPNGDNYEETVSSLVAPGEKGSFGILAKHTPFIFQLKEGFIDIKKESQAQRFGIGAGMLEVKGDHDVLILADYLDKNPVAKNSTS